MGLKDPIGQAQMAWQRMEQERVSNMTEQERKKHYKEKENRANAMTQLGYKADRGFISTKMLDEVNTRVEKNRDLAIEEDRVKRNRTVFSSRKNRRRQGYGGMLRKKLGSD